MGLAGPKTGGYLRRMSSPLRIVIITFGQSTPLVQSVVCSRVTSRRISFSSLTTFIGTQCRKLQKVIPMRSSMRCFTRPARGFVDCPIVNIEAHGRNLSNQSRSKTISASNRQTNSKKGLLLSMVAKWSRLYRYRYRCVSDGCPHNDPLANRRANLGIFFTFCKTLRQITK
jgi:hypothetical protein